MAKKKLRAGVIGAGAVAQGCHMPGYGAHRQAELVAVADVAPARLKEAKAAYPAIATYRDYTQMLAAEALDVVSVCVPNAGHAPAALAALKAGCHVLCEKPMAIRLREADQMMDAAKKARKKLRIAFSHRFMSGPAKCKEMLEKKAIGKPFMMRVRFAHGGPHPGWAKDKNTFYDPKVSAGGALLDMGIHAIDLCHWLFGPITGVSARTVTMVKRIPVDDNAVMLLDFKSGALGYIEAGWTSQPGFVGIEIYGTKGSLICDYLNELKLCSGKASAGTDSVTRWKTLDKTPASGGWPYEMKCWIDMLRGKGAYSADAKAGKAALAVALAAYKSSKSGRRVGLE